MKKRAIVLSLMAACCCGCARSNVTIPSHMVISKDTKRSGPVTYSAEDGSFTITFLVQPTIQEQTATTALEMRMDSRGLYVLHRFMPGKQLTAAQLEEAILTPTRGFTKENKIESFDVDGHPAVEASVDKKYEMLVSDGVSLYDLCAYGTNTGWLSKNDADLFFHSLKLRK